MNGTAALEPPIGKETCVDAFNTIGAAEVLASATLAGYLWAGYRYAFPLSPSWANAISVLICGIFSSFLVLEMEDHNLTRQHIASHIVIGILAAATIAGLRQVHSINAERAAVAREEKGRNGNGTV